MSQTVASHPLRDRMLGATRPGPEEAQGRRAAEEQNIANTKERRRAEEAAIARHATQGEGVPAGYRADGRRERARGRGLSLTA
ncbi:MAG: hypothetical protein ACKOUS_17090 [Alphaproteobacteria bacterium]